MDVKKLQKKIHEEIKGKEIFAVNYANALANSPEDFQKVVEAWMEGIETDYEFQGITLDMIRKKENCSYLRAMFRMKILLDDPSLADGYESWDPIYM